MTTAVPTTPHEASLLEMARPFALMAIMAFILGFAGYLALGRPALAGPQPTATVAAETVETAPTSDDWNFPKRI